MLCLAASQVASSGGRQLALCCGFVLCLTLPLQSHGQFLLWWWWFLVLVGGLRCLGVLVAWVVVSFHGVFVVGGLGCGTCWWIGVSGFGFGGS